MSRYSLAKKDDGFRLSAEAGQAAVMKVIEYYQIDIDSQPDRKTQKVIEGVCDRLVRSYRMGLLENKMDGNVLRIVQHLAKPPGEAKDLNWDKMSAKAKLATDGFDADDRYARSYALIACLTGLPPEGVHALEGADLSTAEDLGVLFLLG